MGNHTIKILLVSMNAYSPDKSHYYPLSLGHLSPILKDKGYHVLCLNLFNSSKENAISIYNKTLKEFKPDVIGFNCITQNRGGTYSAIKETKKFNKNILIILGGVHASVMPDQLLEKFPIDYIVKGEGENALLYLLENLGNLKSKIIFSQPSIDLNDLPIPDHSYASDWIKQNKTAHIITSRGCPAKCLFCSTSAFWGNKVRYKSVEAINEEIEMLIDRYGITDLLFHDDTFNINEDRVVKIAEKLMNKNISWKCNARVTPINKDLLSIMKRSGCVQIRFGVESTSESIMRTLGKNITKDQIYNCFELCKDAGINTFAFMIAGLPGETEETINETTEFLSKLTMSEPPAVSLPYVYPGTRLYNYCKDRNLITDDFWINEEKDYVLTENQSIDKLTKWAGKISIAPKIL